MGTMYPPELLDAEVKSHAERLVFAALRDGLPDTWSVFHSAGVIVRDPREGAIDDETDFVLCHPGRPVIAVEVKGGGIDCRRGAWYRTRPGEQPERIVDPFTQAIDHKHNLRRKLEGVGGEGLHVVHAVWFPQLNPQSLVLAPDAPPELVLGRADLEKPTAAVERVVKYHAGREQHGRAANAKDLELVRELLCPEISIPVPMAVTFTDEEEQLVRLTYEQAAALKQLHNNRRLAVHGCAGSGKTMLGVERAKRLVAAGGEVGFICFNKGLCAHLRATEHRSGVRFHHFHSLCVSMAKRAGVELPAYDGDAPPSFFDEDLPTALLEAVDVSGAPFDHLVVDEAQDLRDHWFEALQATLRDPDEGSVWLFLDDNQRIYDEGLTVPEDYFRWDLTINCRNTRAIHREVLKLYEGDILPDVRGPLGRDVELHLVDDQPATVAALIHRLCVQEEVLPQDIAVLSSHAAAKSEVAHHGAGAYGYTADRQTLGRFIHFSSIRAFKGLESPVVILCELEDLDARTRDHQLYVGLSRARNHAIVVAPPAPA